MALTTQERLDLLVDESIKNNTPISLGFLDWLQKNGFFNKPAALKHHGNYSGGLFDHSLAVANKLSEMTNTMNIKWQNPRSPYIVGMFHDLCKLEDYHKIADGGEWVFNNDKILAGHGDKSIMLLSQFMTLTEEEILCIRFHMGAFQTDDWAAYDKAIRKYESVLWTHTADMYASKVLNK
jgi:23S rRNA maturation-related 3'-5' exoribonuclease YhaM